MNTQQTEDFFIHATKEQLIDYILNHWNAGTVLQCINSAPKPHVPVPSRITNTRSSSSSSIHSRRSSIPFRQSPTGGWEEVKGEEGEEGEEEKQQEKHRRKNKKKHKHHRHEQNKKHKLTELAKQQVQKIKNKN